MFQQLIKFLLIPIFFIFCQVCPAQSGVVYDTASISARSFNANSLKKYKADPTFQYEVAAERPRSIWQRFWSRFWEWIGEMLASKNGVRNTRIFLITFSILVLVAVVFIFLGMGKNGLFGKRNREDPLAYSVSEDDIHAINFDLAIEKAISDGNFRFAVRLLYLQTLKNLTDAGIINWQLNKTNIAYLNELGGKTYQQSFRELTYQFESNWYGDLPISAAEFQHVKDRFQQFNQNVS